MWASVIQGSNQRNYSLSNGIVGAILAIMRNIVSLTVLWILVSGNFPNQSQTEAMKASPHTFVVVQDDEEIVLKIKGDESDHWVTNQNGEKEQSL